MRVAEPWAKISRARENGRRNRLWAKRLSSGAILALAEAWTDGHVQNFPFAAVFWQVFEKFRHLANIC
jgi:hypothetical protein